MNKNLKELLSGLVYGLLAIVFMLGILPWDLISRILGCIMAMLAILRINKKKRNGEQVWIFTVAFMLTIIAMVLLFNSLSIAA